MKLSEEGKDNMEKTKIYLSGPERLRKDGKALFEEKKKVFT